MSNSYTNHILKDTTEHVVIKLTGKFDGSGQELNHARIAANSLYGALDSSRANLLVSTANTGPLSYYGLTLHRLWYDCGCTGDVELYWHADNPVPLMYLNGNGEYDGAGNWVTISNNAKDTANCNGDILVTTRGMVANDSYTIVAEFRKENEYYQRGQFNDPGAFNYGQYSLKP
jgi:hypothetical protein